MGVVRRNRAPISDGYVRKTVTLPASLMGRIEKHLEGTPGLTTSAFLSDAGEQLLDRIAPEKRRT